MTTMTLAPDENARGMQRLFMNELLLTPAMYADPESQMKTGFDAVYDRVRGMGSEIANSGEP